MTVLAAEALRFDCNEALVVLEALVGLEAY